MNVQGASVRTDNASGSFQQACSLVENTIRRLEETKRSIESYKEAQKNGVSLSGEEQSLMAKSGTVDSIWENMVDLRQQFSCITSDVKKTQQQGQQQQKKKKQPAKLRRGDRRPVTSVELRQHYKDNIKELLLVQDVLENMRRIEVRQDFLAGVNGAVQLSPEDVSYLDEFYLEVSCVCAEEGFPAYQDQLQKCAEHLLALVKGLDKTVCGTTYAKLKNLIMKIHMCGYFDRIQNTAQLDTSQRQECDLEHVEGIANCMYSQQQNHCPVLEESNCIAKNNEIETEATDSRKKYHCVICKSWFFTKYHLLRHQYSCVNKTPPYRCAFCGAIFYKSDLLRTHLHAHVSRTTVYSEDCKSAAAQDGIIDQRQTTCNGTKQQLGCAVCELCLAAHMHNLQRRGWFACVVCNAKFPRRTSVMKHMSIHPGEGPFDCCGCRSRFNLEWNRAEKLEHTCTNRFSCPICDVRFTLQANLKKHIFTHHDKNLFSFPTCKVNISETM